jgi:hypothetical protein
MRVPYDVIDGALFPPEYGRVTRDTKMEGIVLMHYYRVDHKEILFSGYFLKKAIILHMEIKVKKILYIAALARP